MMVLTAIMFAASGLVVIAPFMYLGALFMAVFDYRKMQKDEIIKEHAAATGVAVAKALSEQRQG